MAGVSPDRFAPRLLEVQAFAVDRRAVIPCMPRRWALLTLLLAFTVAVPASAQDPTEVRGEAILSHPAGKLALQVAELLAAGKTDEVLRLRSAEDQADWKKESAAERKAMSERMRARAPEPAALTEGIRKGGVLTVYAGRASLESPYRDSSVVALFTLEGAQWRASVGPMVMEGPPPSAPETRLEGAQIESHPIYDLALRYADALHSGKADGFMALASSKAQAAWRAYPASERAESTRYRKKTVPTRSALAGAIRSGGLLMLQGDTTASLNITTVEQQRTTPGTVSAASTTMSLPFVLENGVWKVAQ
jgi:hypothetical protein